MTTVITDGNFSAAVALWQSDSGAAETLYGSIATWNVSAVTNMTGAFMDLPDFCADLSEWDVSNVTNMTDMFNGATNFRSDLSSWDVRNVVTFTRMFKDAQCIEFNIRLWLVGCSVNVDNMFRGATNFNGIYLTTNGYGNSPDTAAFFTLVYNYICE